MAAENPPLPSREQSTKREGWWTREHTMVLVLAALTVVLIGLSVLLTAPFLAPLSWALALAVVAHPLHRWMVRKIAHPNLAAALAVASIAVLILTPAVFVGQSVAREVVSGLEKTQTGMESGKWQQQLAAHPRIASAVQFLGEGEGVVGQVQTIAGDVAKRVWTALSGSIFVVVELLLTLFILFFFFRDQGPALAVVRSLVPLSEREADKVFSRANDTLHATIYGTLTVALVQGTLGGLMFWWLGLPAPILWGAVMALLAIVPVLGAFVVWVPAALFLGFSGHWGKAAILAVWGVVVIGLIDNLLYPRLVGKRLHLHTLPVFISLVGGIAVFGAVGLVLGPLILSLTDAVLEVWRLRTAHGRPADATLPEARK